MSVKDGQRLEPLATEIVGKLDAVANTAKSWLANPRRLRAIALLSLIEQATGKNVSGRDSEDTVKAFGAALLA